MPITTTGAAFPIRFGRIGKLVRVWPLYLLVAAATMFGRRRGRRLVFWQQAIGIVYAGLCRLLRINPSDEIYILMFILVPKKRRGLSAKLVEYALGAKQVRYVCSYNQSETALYRSLFPSLAEKFVDLPFCEEIPGVERFIVTDKGYFLDAGRSNRDHAFLVEAFRANGEKLVILDDYKHSEALPENVQIITDAYGDRYFQYISDCRALVFAFLDPVISAGQLVFLHGAQLGKPAVVVRSHCLDGYAEDGVNSLAVDRTVEGVEKAVRRLRDPLLAEALSAEAKRLHSERHSLRTLAKAVSSLLHRRPPTRPGQTAQ